MYIIIMFINKNAQLSGTSAVFIEMLWISKGDWIIITKTLIRPCFFQLFFIHPILVMAWLRKNFI